MTHIFTLITLKEKIILLLLVTFATTFELVFFATFAEIVNGYIFGSQKMSSTFLKNFEQPVLLTVLICLISYSIKLYFNYYQHIWSFSLSHRIFLKISDKLLRPTNQLKEKDYYIDILMGRMTTLTTIFIQSMQSMQATIVIFLVTCYMCYINWMFTLISLGVLVGSYLLLIFYIQTRLATNSKIIGEYAPKLIASVDYLVSSGRQLKNNSIDIRKLTDVDYLDNKYRMTFAENLFISSSPRLLFEAIIFVGILFSLLISNQNKEVIAFLVLALIAAQRILPSLQTIYQTLATVRAHLQPLVDLLDELKLEINSAPVSIYKKTKNIRFEKISTVVGDKIITYDNISLDKKKNYILTGSSGSGKTVLLDILSGLRTFSGSLEIDQKKHRVVDGILRWECPCSIYRADNQLFNTDIKNNIFYNKTKREFNKLMDNVDLSNLVDSATGKYSLGQQQRLLLIRSITKSSDSIFWDEPTSALDKKNQNLISSLLNIISKDKFCVISTHHPDLFSFKEIKVSDHRKIKKCTS